MIEEATLRPKPRVACLGIVVADLIARPVDRLPERGKLSAVEEMTLHPGGCAVNTSIALAKLGAPASILGMTGDDTFGKFLRKTLEEHGVDVRGLKRRRDCSTSATMVLVHQDGERSFIHHLGANARFGATDIDFAIIAECQFLHVAGALIMPALDGPVMAEVLQEARRRTIVTSLDTAWDASGRWLRSLQPCLPHIDYFMPSIEEARELSGLEQIEDILRFFIDRGAATVILKMGAGGSMARSGNRTLTVPAIRSEAVDSTGAGDCFAAGFLRGLVEGRDIERCLQLGNAAGAQCVRALGATTGVTSLEDALKLLQQ